MAPPVFDAHVLTRWAALYPDEPLLVWTSGGKDSFCCLKLACAAVGPARVFPVYRYLVEGVRCVETPIKAQLYALRIPNPLVSVPGLDTLEMLRMGVYTTAQAVRPGKVRAAVKFRDVERLARKRTGCTWTVSGEKQVDSVMRRLWLRRLTDGVDVNKQKLFPVHQWSQKMVRVFCQTAKAPLAPNFGGEITSGLSFRVLDQVRARYPDDYARILHAFPFAEALAFRDRTYGERPRSLHQLEQQRQRALEVPDGDGGEDSAEPDPAGALQPAPGE
jgi:hypothetical protein